MDEPRRTNRLIRETSPYLLQHAHNPVDWYPWGPEALTRAKTEDRPILLSIGYAACHWCHVMERESFENEAIAKLMNEHFVCIKVDREERPDLDDVYMAATIAMSGHGGWPMTVFLTPAQEPFFAGTYFPPEDRYGRVGFGSLLSRIAELWRSERSSIDAQANNLTETVRQQLGSVARAPLTAGLIARAVDELGATYDAQRGGFGAAPKFPPSAALRLLLRHFARSGDTRALAMARGTLDSMKNGGIYDHVGGGFARYAVDAAWHVPHFEKMLYDNAQLARVYLEAYQLTGDGEYRRVVTETLDYLLREMQAEGGGFYSATDADSEGVEGKFFTFTADEIRGILSEPLASQFCAYYGVSRSGNWEHTNVLWTQRPLAEVAAELGLESDMLRANLARAREKIYAARKERVPPLTDDKILVSWNALLIASLAEAARVLGEARYLQAAKRAAHFILSNMIRADGGLYRTARGERAHLDAYLEDYAYLGDALIDVYESSGERTFLTQAEQLCERMLRDFRDVEGGGFFHTAHAHEALIARSRDVQDDALPNANAIAAQLCARLSFHLARTELGEIAKQTLESFGLLLSRAPRAFVSLLAVQDLLERGPIELAIVGDPLDPGTEALRRAIAEVYLPQRIIGYSRGADDGSAPPLAQGKPTIAQKSALYVCRNFTCGAPVTDPAGVRRALELTP